MGALDKKNSPYFIEQASEIFLAPECFNCDLKGLSLGLTFYDPKILPGSIFYPLISFQEDAIKKQSDDFKSILNYYLTITDRRIIEAKSIVDREIFLHKLEETLGHHRDALFEFKKIVDEEEWKMSGKEESTIAEQIIGHLLAQATWAEELYNNPLLSAKSKKILAGSYETILSIESSARNKVWITRNSANKRFIFELPKKGKYNVYVKKGSLAHQEDTERAEISLAERPESKITPKGEVGGWLSYGPMEINNDRLRLALKDSTVKNLLESVMPILPSDRKGIVGGGGAYSFTTDSIDKCLLYKISNLETVGARYRFSFEYRNLTDGKDLSFYLSFPGSVTRKLDILGTFLPNTRSFRVEERFIEPRDGRINIFFCNGFATRAQKLKGEEVRSSLIPGQTLFEIKEIKLVKVSIPVVVLYKKQKELDKVDYVQSFEKKSPVLYTAEIKENLGPMSLIIREGYGKYWQVCEVNGACYPFHEKIHFASAEYGNAWYFEDGIKGRIKVYYLPQQMFNVGSYISIGTLVIIFFVLWWKILRKRPFT